MNISNLPWIITKIPRLAVNEDTLLANGMPHKEIYFDTFKIKFNLHKTTRRGIILSRLLQRDFIRKRHSLMRLVWSVFFSEQSAFNRFTNGWRTRYYCWHWLYSIYVSCELSVLQSYWVPLDRALIFWRILKQ